MARSIDTQQSAVRGFVPAQNDEERFLMRLTIQAVRSHSNDEKDKEGRYLRRETFSGTCARSFYVGDAVKKEDIHAKFEDGILHITLPAPQHQKALPVNPNLIEIE